MTQSPYLPSVVIVGRPNVGKSTLFNRILRQRRAIVGNESGITRDRIHGEAEYRGHRFELIDSALNGRLDIVDRCIGGIGRCFFSRYNCRDLGFWGIGHGILAFLNESFDTD